MAIIVEQIDKSGHVLRLDKLDSAQIRLGRAFDNDVILTDVSVDAHHCLLTWDAASQQLRAQDQGALNGIWILDARGKKQRLIGTGAIQSGQCLMLGKTLLRIYDSAHPVPPAKPAHIDEAITGFLGHWSVVLMLALSAIGLDVFNQYLDQPIGQHYAEFAVQSLYGILGIAVYSGFWALLGKNLLHDARYGFHLGLSFLLVNVWMLGVLLGPWVMFNLQLSAAAGLWLNKVLVSVLGGGALYVSCLYATRLTLKPRLATVCLLPLALLTPLVVKLVDKNSFKARPSYSHILVSPGAQWRSPADADTFMPEAEALYKPYDVHLDDEQDDTSDGADDDADFTPTTPSFLTNRSTAP